MRVVGVAIASGNDTQVADHSGVPNREAGRRWGNLWSPPLVALAVIVEVAHPVSAEPLTVGTPPSLRAAFDAIIRRSRPQRHWEN